MVMHKVIGIMSHMIELMMSALWKLKKKDMHIVSISMMEIMENILFILFLS